QRGGLRRAGRLVERLVVALLGDGARGVGPPEELVEQAEVARHVVRADRGPRVGVALLRVDRAGQEVDRVGQQRLGAVADDHPPPGDPEERVEAVVRLQREARRVDAVPPDRAGDPRGRGDRVEVAEGGRVDVQDEAGGRVAHDYHARLNSGVKVISTFPGPDTFTARGTVDCLGIGANCRDRSWLVIRTPLRNAPWAAGSVRISSTSSGSMTPS